MGAVSMKMSKSTSTTSTRGMMLISASDVPIRRLSPPSSNLNAIFRGAPELGWAAEDVQQVEGEAVHLGRPVLHAVDEVVVPDDGGGGSAASGPGGERRRVESGGGR